MKSLSGYRERHAELLQTIDDLQSILTMEQLRIRPNAKTAYQLLCDLADKVKQHLAEEDKGLSYCQMWCTALRRRGCRTDR